MKKALFILMLVAVGVFGWALLSSPRVPAWRPKTEIHFVGFVDSTTVPPITNVWRVITPGLSALAASPPATYALFEIKDPPGEETIWHLIEVSQQGDGKWKRSEPEPIKMVSGGIRSRAAVRVPTTNAPLRVVIELELLKLDLRKPPTGKVAQFFWDLRLRWKRWRHPNDTKRWLPRGPLFRIINEFNFTSGTNAAVVKKETGR